MHIGRRYMRIGDDRMAAVDSAVIEIEEALGLAVAHHITAIGIGTADLRFLHLRLALFLPQRLLPMGYALRLDRSIQIGPIIGPRLLEHGQIVFALVGIGLQMGRIRIEHGPIHQTMPDRLLHDGIEYILGNLRPVEATAAVLRQRRGIEDRIGQLQAQKPAIGDVHLDLAHQLPLRANTEQVADEQRLEHACGIERRTAVVGTVKTGNTIMDK